MKMVVVLFAISVFALPVAPSAAHHSPAMFDLSQDLVIEGVVRDVSWANPHVYFAVESTADDGSPVEWQVEAGPAANLAPIGLDASSIRPGDRVVVNAKPNRRSGSPAVLGWVLTGPDGRQVPLHVRAAAALSAVSADGGSTGPAATSLSGTWLPQARGFSALSFAARNWPLTDAARAAIPATAGARAEARATCVPFGPPALMALPAIAIIEVDADAVTFRLDTMAVVRTVRLDQAAHPADIEPSVLGHSIGHFEGSTLVVDTVAFAAHPEGYAFDLPSSAAKHVVERFTLVAEGRQIEYHAIVEDPGFLAEPVEHRSLWDYRPEQQPSGLPCDLESARRFAEFE